MESSNDMELLTANGKVTFYNLKELMLTVGGLHHFLFREYSGGFYRTISGHSIKIPVKSDRQIKLDFSLDRMGTDELVDDLFAVLNRCEKIHLLVEPNDANIEFDYSFYDCILVSEDHDISEGTYTLVLNVTGEVVEDRIDGRQSITCREVR